MYLETDLEFVKGQLKVLWLIFEKKSSAVYMDTFIPITGQLLINSL